MVLNMLNVVAVVAMWLLLLYVFAGLAIVIIRFPVAAIGGSSSNTAIQGIVLYTCRVGIESIY